MLVSYILQFMFFAISNGYCFVCIFRECSMLSFNVLIWKKLEKKTHLFLGWNSSAPRQNRCTSSCRIRCAVWPMYPQNDPAAEFSIIYIVVTGCPGSEAAISWGCVGFFFSFPFLFVSMLVRNSQGFGDQEPTLALL